MILGERGLADLDRTNLMAHPRPLGWMHAGAEPFRSRREEPVLHVRLEPLPVAEPEFERPTEIAEPAELPELVQPAELAQPTEPAQPATITHPPTITQPTQSVQCVQTAPTIQTTHPKRPFEHPQPAQPAPPDLTGLTQALQKKLGTARVSLAALREHLRGSEVSSVKAIAGLFQEHASDLGNYLSSDPKGMLVPKFVEHLGAELVREHESLQKECDELTQSLEEIRMFLQEQQEKKLKACAPAPKEPGAVPDVSATRRHLHELRD